MESKRNPASAANAILHNKKDKPPRGTYILQSLETMLLNGDAYTSSDELYRCCLRTYKDLDYQTYQADLRFLLHGGLLHLEGRRLYDERIWRYEESAAASLANVLQNNSAEPPVLPAELAVGSLALAAEQRTAVERALSHRLSMILGGPGTGKSTLIRAIADHCPGDGVNVICAPTGKAARALTTRTGCLARTVHSALGMHPDEDFLAPVEWGYTKLVIVDESSMLTLEMLAGILHRAPEHCRIVLLGDPFQLLSVGPGNVIPDLLALGIPRTTLETTHRQAATAVGLHHNVTQFGHLWDASQLVFDDSFQLHQLPEARVQAALRDEAARRYRAGEQIQVLSPFNKASQLSVHALNQAIRPLVNPETPQQHRLALSEKSEPFLNGDRVLILKNNRVLDCSNGDLGTLRIDSDSDQEPEFAVELPDGRRPRWYHISGLLMLTHAYALTVHRAQGSEYDTVLMPVSRCLSGMMVRNLLYTAISRAREKVILFGDMESLHTALQRVPRERNSMLVTKTRMRLQQCA